VCLFMPSQANPSSLFFLPFTTNRFLISFASFATQSRKLKEEQIDRGCLVDKLDTVSSDIKNTVVEQGNLTRQDLSDKHKDVLGRLDEERKRREELAAKQEEENRQREKKAEERDEVMLKKIDENNNLLSACKEALTAKKAEGGREFLDAAALDSIKGFIFDEKPVVTVGSSTEEVSLMEDESSRPSCTTAASPFSHVSNVPNVNHRHGLQETTRKTPMKVLSRRTSQIPRLSSVSSSTSTYTSRRQTADISYEPRNGCMSQTPSKENLRQSEINAGNKHIDAQTKGDEIRRDAVANCHLLHTPTSRYPLRKRK